MSIQITNCNTQLTTTHDGFVLNQLGHRVLADLNDSTITLPTHFNTDKTIIEAHEHNSMLYKVVLSKTIIELYRVTIVDHKMIITKVE
jgi:hypothetical protein